VVRRLILSRTVAFTVIGGSRPRGPGAQAMCVGRAFVFFGVVTVVPFLNTGTTVFGLVGGGGAIEVTPAQVEGGVGNETKRSTSFSERNMLLKLII